ncbi:MAG: spermidine/putrescine ABC transporter substrate-binding protein [Lachnospiraceae bacterium]
MKKKLISVLLCITMLVSFAGCGGKSEEKTEKVTDKYDGQELNAFLWPEYIPDSVIQDFEDAYGVKVNVSTFSSNEEMLSKLQNSAAGTYDIVNPSDYMVEYMIENKLLAKLDKTALTNYKNLDEQYLGQDYDPQNEYSVPFAPGEIILAYDKTAVSDKITGLNDIFDKKYKSSIVVLDDPKIVIGLVNKSLGFGLNEEDEGKLVKTKERMMQFKDNVYSLKFEGTQDMLLNGECSLGYIFNGNVALAQMESDDIVPVFPEEGSYIWIDNLCIPEDSKKQELANIFINYILDAKVDEKIRTEIPSTDPNKAGWELVGDDLKDTALTIPKDSWEKGEYAANLDEKTNTTYTNMYAEFTK